MRPVKHGSADQSVVVRIVDAGDGSPETGVTAATAGLDLWYRREGGAVVSLTESDLAAADSAHGDGGIKHIAAGLYRVDLPDAAFLTGSAGVMVGGSATGMVVIPCYVPLVAYDPQLAGMGLVLAKTTNITGFNDLAAGDIPTAEENAAAGLAAINADAGFITLLAVGSALDEVLVDDGAGSWEYTAGALANAPTGGSAPSAADIWAHGARTLTAGTNIVLAKGTGVTGFNDIAATAIVSGGAITTSGGAVSTVTTAGTVTTVSDKTGYSLNLAQVGFTPRALDAIADGSLTLGDVLIAGLVGGVGDESIVGTAYTKKTPSTATTVRTFTLSPDGTNPTSRT